MNNVPIKITFKNNPPILISKLNNNQTLLDLAHSNSIKLEGACEGSLACSTCHVILPEEVFKLYNEPSEKEYDLLDGVFQGTDTSRLACQIPIDNRLNGAIIRIPKASRNFYVDGFQPKHH